MAKGYKRMFKLCKRRTYPRASLLDRRCEVAFPCKGESDRDEGGERLAKGVREMDGKGGDGKGGDDERGDGDEMAERASRSDGKGVNGEAIRRECEGDEH